VINPVQEAGAHHVEARRAWARHYSIGLSGHSIFLIRRVVRGGAVRSMTSVLGLDIGGANLKAAHESGVAHTRPFPLWKQPDRLAAELRSIRAAMPAHDRLAVTMTGELCDCFAGKRDGVLAILQSVEEAAAGTAMEVWTTGGKFVDAAQVCRHPLPAAAANWLALAHLAVRLTDQQPALLIDAGSTTTDLLFLDGGRPCPRALTDRDRMASGELVYTGVRRTPVCAVLGMGIAAEVFATMLDVYLLLGLLPDDSGNAETADGRTATRAHARGRLARMLCAEAVELPPQELEGLAQRALETQVRHLCGAVDQVLAGRAVPRRMVLAGSGEVLGRQIQNAHPVLAGLPVVSLAERLGPALSEAACAYAVAVLASTGIQQELPPGEAS
jgi:probable H4MPT-linked C1 transfer pathway protein